MELIIGAILGVFVGLYIGNDKARRWVNQKLKGAGKKQKNESGEKPRDE